MAEFADELAGGVNGVGGLLAARRGRLLLVERGLDDRLQVGLQGRTEGYLWSACVVER